jgi:hypothetical protein
MVSLLSKEFTWVLFGSFNAVITLFIFLSLFCMSTFEFECYCPFPVRTCFWVVGASFGMFLVFVGVYFSPSITAARGIAATLRDNTA